MSVAAEIVGNIRNRLGGLGFRPETLIPDYEFSDLAAAPTTKRLTLAAFSDTPPSYRTAAIGVLQANDPGSAVLAHRDLGAPHWLCLTGGAVESWVIRDDVRAERMGVHRYDELDALFERHRLDWTPESIQRAKLIGRNRSGSQFEFGFPLLTAIQNRVYARLDKLIREALEQMCEDGKYAGNQLQVPVRLAFAMIASKVLIDRGHPAARQWATGSFESVVDGISNYYTLDHLNLPTARYRKDAAEKAWATFKASVNLRNVSAEDLAFVYEHTLVTDDTRNRWGTHSTPRPVAEYIVDQLRLEDFNLDTIKVFEPFCGAAVLLVAAAKKLRALLPRDWNDAKRHSYLVGRLRGVDVDEFAKQVATLSLILADYPNKNGWDINVRDLFEDSALHNSMPEGAVALCNPPFEDFEPRQRQKYRAAAASSVHKPLVVLQTVLKRNPIALGFVMPSSLVGDATYRDIRNQLTQNFDEIELVSLPDRVFENSAVESSLVIARRSKIDSLAPTVRTRSVSVRDYNRDDFLLLGKTPAAREEVQPRGREASNDLWLPELVEVWRYLAEYPTLSSCVTFHRGVEWRSGHQAGAFSPVRREGFKRGFHNVERGRAQFMAPVPVFLDWREAYRRGNSAFDLPWEKNKVLLNAARLSRGPWRVASWVDTGKSVASQQFVGAWLRDGARISLNTLSAILNSPIANAYLFAMNERKGIRLSTLENIPIAQHFDTDLIDRRVNEYLRLAADWQQTIMADNKSKGLDDALLAIDAAVLRAYDLPPRLERQLLDLFSGARRPVLSEFRQYFPEDFPAFIPLEDFWALRTRESSRKLSDVIGPLSLEQGQELERWT